MRLDDYTSYLSAILAANQTEAGAAWLRKQIEQLHSEKAFYLAFSQVPRFVGKQPLHLTSDQLAEAAQLRAGFNPGLWTVDQAVRTLLLLQVPHHTSTEYSCLLKELFSVADLSELATLYAALPLLPYPESHRERAAEGVRTTMTSVFDAIALNNPYPHDYLPTQAWNQMVLKAVFNARPLHRIYGLDNRRNAALAHMLIDYAHERWAASRALTPEVWRLVGPYLTTDNMPDVERLFQSSNELENQAGALALAESNSPEIKDLLSQHSDIEMKIRNGDFTWQSIGERAYTA
ncbi:hypothetical protein GCM10011375_27030 [Hymenobacter qilianensis]|uniref:Uncharacterized protein n=2 Tax=Hymenobacter qilianensis TaxID=1385715 RepID=A0ACB5PTJ8_9BACT|nr:EboA domain-containing protein [Hymenobacter qilianensis]QNP52770.1 EboA domain-containing protein [Hymenobacter qilianensis]GGF70526.1 hypothetical protein GCM10011375_27030 [Hymenobacter qilianensis]